MRLLLSSFCPFPTLLTFLPFPSTFTQLAISSGGSPPNMNEPAPA